VHRLGPGVGEALAVVAHATRQPSTEPVDFHRDDRVWHRMWSSTGTRPSQNT
jgi:hypothetical protein